MSRTTLNEAWLWVIHSGWQVLDLLTICKAQTMTSGALWQLGRIAARSLCVAQPSARMEASRGLTDTARTSAPYTRLWMLPRSPARRQVYITTSICGACNGASSHIRWPQHRRCVCRRLGAAPTCRWSRRTGDDDDQIIHRMVPGNGTRWQCPPRRHTGQRFDVVPTAPACIAMQPTRCTRPIPRSTSSVSSGCTAFQRSSPRADRSHNSRRLLVLISLSISGDSRPFSADFHIPVRRQLLALLTPQIRWQKRMPLWPYPLLPARCISGYT